MDPAPRPDVISLEQRWPPPAGGVRSGLLGNFFLIDLLERSGADAIRRFQAQRLHDWLGHLATVRDDVRKSIAAGAASSLPDLRALPRTDREMLRDFVESRGPIPMPADHGKPLPNSTSGSSGVPLRFFYSERSGRFNSVLYLHDHLRHGRNPSRAINLIGGKAPPHDGEHHERENPEALLETGLVRVRKATAFSVESHADWLRRHPAPYLVVHGTLFSGVLDLYEREGRPAQGIEQVLTGAETIDDSLRRRAREQLGAKIVDRYSAEESGPIAFQCPVHDDWYHVCVANVLVETVNEAGERVPEGVPGRVLVSAFNNWAVPLLRYEVGDLAAMYDRCRCGADVPALTQLLGRRRGLVRLPDGERRYLRIVAADLLDFAPVREWRVTQREPLALEVEVVCAAPLRLDQREGIAARLREITHPEFRVHVVERDAIHWGASYKRHDFVCLLDD